MKMNDEQLVNVISNTYKPLRSLFERYELEILRRGNGYPEAGLPMWVCNAAHKVLEAVITEQYGKHHSGEKQELLRVLKEQLAVQIDITE